MQRMFKETDVAFQCMADRHFSRVCGRRVLSGHVVCVLQVAGRTQLTGLGGIDACSILVISVRVADRKHASVGADQGLSQDPKQDHTQR